MNVDIQQMHTINLIIHDTSELVVRYWKPLTLLLLIIITGLCLRVPTDAAPGIPGIDKLQHLMAYAALAFPVSLAKPRYLQFWLLALFCWSGIIELIQPLVGREWDILDLLANGCGLLLGMSAAGLLLKINSLTANRLSGVY